VNVAPGVDFVEPANLQRYASLVEVFDALCQEDTRLFDYLLDPANKTYPITCLGTKSLGLGSLADKERLLAAVRHAVRHGSHQGKKLTERMLRAENIPWEVGFGELKRIVTQCKRYVKTTDSFVIGKAVVNFYRFYERCQDGYRLWKEGKPTFLEPFQIADLTSLPSWEPYGALGPYPWKQCMAFLENWLSTHNGELPMVEIHKGGYIGLDATDLERLSGALTCCNQADGKLRGANNATGYTLPPEKQADLKRIAERFSLRWCKQRDDRGELVPSGPKTFIQVAYERFKKYYEINGPKGPYIQQWYPGYPLKHRTQEDPTVPRSALPPRYKVEKRKLEGREGKKPKRGTQK